MYSNTTQQNTTWMIAIILCTCFFLSACGSKKSSPKVAVSSNKGQAISKTAQSQLGKYYRFGGTSPKTGFDCSGLIQWAYKQHGVKVPRQTVAQAKTGKRIKSSKARPGDIIVFKSRNSGTGLHTGIYVGDNKFIHSPRKGAKIRIESLNKYWKPKLISVRRIV